MTKPRKPEQSVNIQGGEVLASLEDRTVTGLLIPFNEIGRTNVGMFQVEAGAVAIPADPAVVGINTDHVRENVVGRATRIWEQPEGVMATFSIANTPEGDAVLADLADPNGKRKKLSGEFGPAVLAGGKLVPGHARVWGAGFVEAGAFPSAMVLAADTEGTSRYETEFTDEDGVKWRRVDESVTTTETTETGTVTETVSTYTEEKIDPAEGDETEEEEPAVTVPQTLATKAKPSTATTAEAVDLNQVYAAVAAVRQDPHDEAALHALAALVDIKTSGAGSVTDGAKIPKPNFVGQLWQGKEYQRKFITQYKLGTEISLAGKQGFTLHRGTAAAPKERLGGTWEGNKTDVPSGNAFTKSAESSRENFAFAADFAREFFDLDGGAPVIEAFMRLIVEDYAMWSDERALAFIRTTAGAPIAPKAYPSVAGHDYPPALGQIIQGILAVTDAKDTPSSAIVNPFAYEQLIYTPKDLLAEFVTLTVNTEGTGTADGKVSIVKAPDSFFTGVDPAKPATIVGARNAIEFDEKGSTPINIDALEIAKGGVDKAVHGYLQKFGVKPDSVVLVGTAKA